MIKNFKNELFEIKLNDHGNYDLTVFGSQNKVCKWILESIAIRRAMNISRMKNRIFKWNKLK